MPELTKYYNRIPGYNGTVVSFRRNTLGLGACGVWFLYRPELVCTWGSILRDQCIRWWVCWVVDMVFGGWYMFAGVSTVYVAVVVVFSGNQGVYEECSLAYFFFCDLRFCLGKGWTS